jgi:hypothetical protein
MGKGLGKSLFMGVAPKRKGLGKQNFEQVKGWVNEKKQQPKGWVI